MLLHGGNIYYYSEKYGIPPERILDFSASINPLGAPKAALKAIKDALPMLANYPDPSVGELKEAVSAETGVGFESILAGNGSTELIYLFPRYFRPKTALVLAPTFSDYSRALALSGCAVRHFGLREADGFVPDMARLEKAAAGADLVVLCNPNNPTGTLLERDALSRLAGTLVGAGKQVVIDEAFIEYAPGESLIREAAKRRGLIVLRNFTKFYGMPGLRLGYLCAHPSLVKKLDEAKEPWSVNTLAVKAAVAALSDKGFTRKSLRVFREEQAFMLGALGNIGGVKVFPSSANFFLVRLPENAEAGPLSERMAEKGILIRDCSNFRGLDGRFVRLAIRTRAENERLVDGLREAL